MRALAWDDRALNELDAIASHISQDNPYAAKRVIEYIVKTAQALEVMRFLGVAIDGDQREFVRRDIRTCFRTKSLARKFVSLRFSITLKTAADHGVAALKWICAAGRDFTR